MSLGYSDTNSGSRLPQFFFSLWSSSPPLSKTPNISSMNCHRNQFRQALLRKYWSMTLLQGSLSSSSPMHSCMPMNSPTVSPLSTIDFLSAKYLLLSPATSSQCQSMSSMQSILCSSCSSSSQVPGSQSSMRDRMRCWGCCKSRKMARSYLQVVSQTWKSSRRRLFSTSVLDILVRSFSMASTRLISFWIMVIEIRYNVSVVVLEVTLDGALPGIDEPVVHLRDGDVALPRHCDLLLGAGVGVLEVDQQPLYHRACGIAGDLEVLAATGLFPLLLFVLLGGFGTFVFRFPAWRRTLAFAIEVGRDFLKRVQNILLEPLYFLNNVPELSQRVHL